MNIEMILVEGGTFNFGNVLPLQVSNFHIGKTPVTVAQYMAFVEDTKTHYPEWLEPGSAFNIKTNNNDYYKQLGSALQADNHPIVGVSWNDAVAFCDWLSKKTGVLYRLPTEVEWEYAAGGGSKDRTEYAGTDSKELLQEYAWYSANSNSRTNPVGALKANAIGLYDMSGNVWEWCWDWYGDYPENPKKDYAGPELGVYRVLRGGGWFDTAERCRVTDRGYNTPTICCNGVGFRIAI